jgi:HisJ family histidinol phosphate phosphatase
LDSVGNRMIRVDNHSHIIHAGILEMVAAAKANDVREYSVTEHVSQFRELRGSVGFGSVHDTGRMFESLNEYREEFIKIKGESGTMKINRGLEVDFSPRYESKVGDFVNQEEWDILLCSVHEFEDGNDIERTGREIVDKLTAYTRWYDYFRLEQLALESDFVPFNVLSHPVRMSRAAVKHVPPEIDDLLMDLATTARRREKALELNGNDIDYAPELVRKLALACGKADCKVSLGSDAHYPNDVFHNMDVALDLVSKFNLKLL